MALLLTSAGVALVYGAAEFERYLIRHDDDRAAWVDGSMRLVLMCGALVALGWAVVHNPLGVFLR